MELTNINVIRQLFERHGFSFTKSLGQNFLINPAVCPKIAEMGGAKPGVCALEIGTGVGVLTKELATRCEKVIAVEIDTTLKPILEETLAEFDNVEIVFADVMETDLAALLAEKAPGMEVVVCANLPYYITSPVIMRVLESRLPVSAMTVMVQKEAADRICAKPGTRDCGAISWRGVLLQRAEAAVQGGQGEFHAIPECGQRGYTPGRQAGMRQDSRVGAADVPHYPGGVLAAPEADRESAFRGASHREAAAGGDNAILRNKAHGARRGTHTGGLRRAHGRAV